MAYQSIWYFTDLNQEIVKTIETDLEQNFDNDMKESQIDSGKVEKWKRNSKNAWVPTTHWLGGFMWHYVQRANRENFLYDLHHIDSETMQYTRYGEGEFYGWHSDSDLHCQYKPVSEGLQCNSEEMIGDFLRENTEYVRKLSFVLQLSDPGDYEGGNLQLLNEEGKSYIAPRQRGTVILFDSRTKHRVQKVRSGVRKSIVGWVVGPRWK